MEIRLDHRAAGTIAPVQPNGDSQRAIGIFTRFHIDAHETTHRGSRIHQRRHVLLARFGGKIQAELRQFDGDVGLHARGPHGAEYPQTHSAARLGLVHRFDVLAKVIERSRDSFRAQLFAHGDGVFQSAPCYETRRHAAGQRRRLHPVTQPAMVRKIEESPAQHPFRW